MPEEPGDHWHSAESGYPTRQTALSRWSPGERLRPARAIVRGERRSGGRQSPGVLLASANLIAPTGPDPPQARLNLTASGPSFTIGL